MEPINHVSAVDKYPSHHSPRKSNDLSNFRSYRDECSPYVKATSFSPFQFMAFSAITISTVINIVNAINNNNNNNDNNNNNNLVSIKLLIIVKQYPSVIVM